MINALKYVEELEQTGFTSEQAKISVTTWIELMNDNLVTKDELKIEMAAVRLEIKDLKIEISEMEKRINKTIVGSVGFFATILGIFVILGKHL